jgi:SAM-dependent methyltransferase
LICKCWKRFPIENIYIFSGYDFKKKFNERRYGSGYKSDKLDYAHKIRLEKALSFVFKFGRKISNSLDTGCDPRMTRFLKEATKSRSIGLNIISEGMDKSGDWVVCDVEIGLPFRDNFFDLIFCGEVIEHTFNTDYFISEVYRILRWFLIITTPNLASFWNRIFLLFAVT